MQWVWMVIGWLGGLPVAAPGMSEEIPVFVCQEHGGFLQVEMYGDENSPSKKSAIDGHADSLGNITTYREKTASEKSSSKPVVTSPSAKPAEKQEKSDPFQVPEGSPEELLKYIEGLRQLEAKGISSRQQMIHFLRNLHKAMVEAADKVLAAKPSPQQRDKAIEAKGQGLLLLLQLGDPTAEEQLSKFAQQLRKEGKKDLARQLEGIILLVQWRQLEGLEAKKKHLEKIIQFVRQERVGIPELRLMAGIGPELEFQTPELAVQAYQQFSQLAAKSNLPIAHQLAKRWEAVIRRLQLIGKPIEIKGYTLDGKEFDWEKFRQGKVVLIDFWATWCGWCIKEIPEMKRLYEAYRDRGFEIVGISGDRNREELEKFLQNTPIPWTILYGKDGPSPTIDYYGISAWPTMLLVDKTGNVVSLNARGENLRKELHRLLGPIEEKEETKSSKEQAPSKQ